MTRTLKLEDFSALGPTPVSAAQAAPPIEPEAALAAFDEGYRNGWDDCARAEAEAHRKIGADLAAGLQDITLTYAEARQDVLAGLGPLFEEIAAQLLPRLGGRGRSTSRGGRIARDCRQRCKRARGAVRCALPLSRRWTV